MSGPDSGSWGCTGISATSSGGGTTWPDTNARWPISTYRQTSRCERLQRTAEPASSEVDVEGREDRIAGGREGERRGDRFAVRCDRGPEPGLVLDEATGGQARFPCRAALDDGAVRCPTVGRDPHPVEE